MNVTCLALEHDYADLAVNLGGYFIDLMSDEYIINVSAVIIAPQNLEDFAIRDIAELTKPRFSIPTHQFLFNAGSINAKFYTDTL